MEQICKNCKYWKNREPGWELNGCCRYNAPIWDGKLPCSADNPPKNMFRARLGSSAIWPTTKAEDFCGKWEMKIIDKATLLKERKTTYDN